MQKNICSICLQKVELDTDILQQNDDIKCVHYSCLNQSQVGQRILAQASFQDQSDEQETQNNTSILKLSKRPAFRKLIPFEQSSTSGCTDTHCNNMLFPVQEYSVDHEVYSRTSKKLSKTYSSYGKEKWFSSVRKHSYRIMPLFIRNKYLFRKGQPNEQSQNKQEEETTVFPFIIDASNVYSSEILDWLATQNKNELPRSFSEKPMPKHAPSRLLKKKVTIHDTRDPLAENRNHYRKSLQRRASHKRRESPTTSIGSQYSNHSHKLNAADFMNWVTSAPKIPNGNMLILLDCRNKKNTKNIGIQPSFDDPERSTARKTTESLILDLLDGRKRNDHYYEYYTNCQGEGSRVTLVKTCATESRIRTSLQDLDHEVSVMEEPRYIYPETVEEKMHHVVSIIFNAVGHLSGFLGRFTKVMKDEFSYGDKNVNLDKKSNVKTND